MYNSISIRASKWLTCTNRRGRHCTTQKGNRRARGQGKGGRGKRRENTVSVIDTEPMGCGPDRPASLSEPNTDYTQLLLCCICRDSVDT